MGAVAPTVIAARFTRCRIRVYDEPGNVRFTSRAMTVPPTPSKTSSPSGPAAIGFWMLIMICLCACVACVADMRYYSATESAAKAPQTINPINCFHNLASPSFMNCLLNI